jgi:RNA polymerase sigma-70 factor (ECF subfamily)
MAFREIVERYQAKVYSIIFGILRNRNDAEDIAQQVFCQVHFFDGQLRLPSSLLTWICKSRSTNATYLRKKRVRKLGL